MSTTRNAAPSPDVLEHFASIGHHEELGSVYGDPEVNSGVSNFLDTVARIPARNLARKDSSEFAPRIE